MESGFEVTFDVHQTFMRMFPIVNYREVREEYGGDIDLVFCQDSHTGEISIKEVRGSVTGVIFATVDLIENGTKLVEINVWEARLRLGPALFRVLGYDPGVTYLCCEWINYEELGYGAD